MLKVMERTMTDTPTAPRTLVMPAGCGHPRCFCQFSFCQQDVDGPDQPGDDDQAASIAEESALASDLPQSVPGRPRKRCLRGDDRGVAQPGCSSSNNSNAFATIPASPGVVGSGV